MVRIPITKPCFGSAEVQAVQQPLHSGWVAQGPQVERFEAAFAQFCGCRHAVASSSGTTALHLGVLALGLQAGQEVLVPAFTWIATANVVEYAGGRPVFVDIDLDSFNLGIRQLDRAFNKRCVGVLPVHLFGLCADMTAISELAQHRGLWVLEDAACALGSWLGNKHAGTFGSAGCFSFHPRKSITTGEGGMLVSDDPALASHVALLRNQGASMQAPPTPSNPGLLPDFAVLGFNYRMTDIQGALGWAQLERAQWILRQRAERARRYDELLSDIAWLRRPVVPSGYRHAYQSYVCLFAPQAPTLANVGRLHEARNQWMQELGRRGVATRPGTHAPVLQSYYQHKYSLRAEDFPNAYLADRLSVALPLYPQMTDEEQDYVVEALQASF